jgi:cell division protease FtsH
MAAVRNSVVKNVVFWALMVVLTLLVWAVVRNASAERPLQLRFSEFISDVESESVAEVTIDGTDVMGTLRKNNTLFRTTIPSNYPDLYKRLTEKNVQVTIKDNSNGSLISWVMNGLPLLLLLGLWIFFMRSMRGRWYSKYYSRQVELLEKQLALLREMNDLLKKLEAKL